MPASPNGSWRYSLKGCVKQESWITILWRWSSYATCSSHSYKEWQRLTSTNPQRHFAARLSTTMQMTFLLLFYLIFLIFFFPGGTRISIGCIHDWAWSRLVLWQQCGWLSDHVYVTKYLGRVTWEQFWLSSVRWRHILPFPKEKICNASAEA